MEKKKKKQKRIIRENQFNTLDNELGSFGLEPPKIYRSEQRDKLGNRDSGRSVKNNKSLRTDSTEQKRSNQNKKRKQKKITRKIIFALIIILSIAVVLTVLSLTVLFKIDTINISGNEKYTQKQISEHLDIEKEKNLFLTDIDKASEKLEEELPYIYKAEISRKLPSTITVKIKEVNKIYAIKNRDKTYTLLDDNFKVIEEYSNKKPENCIIIKKAVPESIAAGKTAVFSDEQMKKDLLALANEISRLKLDEATAIYSTDINNNYIVYDKRITFKLGSTDNLEEKIYLALTAAEKLNETNPQAEGEMTVSNDKQVYFTEKK